MTCICGHHAAVHRAMCGAPEGCDCNQFRKAPAIPDSFVDEAKARQDAEWLAGSEADTAERNLARAYLALCTRAERAEQNVAWRDGVIDDMANKAVALKEQLRTAESALVKARREGAREALTAFDEASKRSTKFSDRNVLAFRDREYPATPSGEGVTYSTQGPTGSGGTRATPQPETPE